MVKLLRLYSPDFKTSTTKLEFENLLNDGVLIKPNGKIALKSCSIPLASKIKITSDNKQFQIEGKNNSTFATVILTEAEYLLDDFISMFNYQILAVLSCDDASQVSWQLELDKKMINEYSIAVLKFSRIVEDVYEDYEFKNSALNANLIQSSGVTTIGDSYVIEKANFLGRCAAYHRCEIKTLGALDLGLINSWEPTEDIPLANLNYYLGTYLDNGNYFYKYFNKDTNQEITTTRQATIDDILSIEVNKGKVRYVVYGNTSEILFEHVTTLYDLSENYRCCVVFEDAIGVIQEPVYIKNPFVKVNQNNEIIKINEDEIETIYASNNLVTGLTNVNMISSLNAKGKFTLKFSQADLRRVLGFESEVYTHNGSKKTFYAESPVDNVYSAKTIIIEIPSLPQLESYDFRPTFNKKRPLLACIPANLSYQNHTLNYSFENPTFLELNNSTPILLRHIRIRALSSMDAKGEEILEISDNSEFVILID